MRCMPRLTQSAARQHVGRPAGCGLHLRGALVRRGTTPWKVWDPFASIAPTASARMMILPSVATTLLKRLAPVVCCAALLSACGGHSSIDPGATAGYVEGFVYQHTGFRATDVRCPSGVPATAGGRFNCHFTGPEGPYTAYLRILNVKGRRVLFDVKTQPSSWPAPDTSMS